MPTEETTMRTSHMPTTTSRASVRRIASRLLTIAALLALPGMARAQNTCNAFISFAYVAGQPFSKINDVVRVQLSLSTGTIQGGTKLNVNRLRFELDCDVDNPLGINCTDDGAVIQYEGDPTITTTCGVVFTTGHPVSDLPKQVVFTPNVPIMIPANTPNFCTLEFDVRVVGLSNDSTPQKAEQVGGFSAATNDARCDNNLASGGSQSAAIDLCPTCTDTECATFACNQQTGVCDPTPLQDSNPCTDNDGNLCTTAGCDGQGNCDQNHITKPCPTTECNTGVCDTGTGLCVPVQPSTPCGDTDQNVCTTAGCELDNPELGVCVQTHIFADNSTPCPDADNNACTTPGCNGLGLCDQAHVTKTCPTTECNTGQCDAGTGLCVPVEPSTPCGDTDQNVCTTAGCELDTPELGVCVQTHIFADDSSPCPDTDQDACTTSGCDGLGVCDQQHVVCVTTTTTTTTTSTSTTTTSLPCIPQTEDCTNMMDDDCDNLVDCDDPDCGDQSGVLVCQDGTQNGQSCATTQQQTDCVNGGGRCVCAKIQKDPSTIRFGSPFDVFQSHGRVEPVGTIDMSTSDVGWVVSGANGVVYSGTLHPSDFIPSTKGTVFRYNNPAARTEGGIFRAKIRITRGGRSYGYKIKAYGEMKNKIADANMSIQFYIGAPAQSFVHSEPWKQLSWGWKATGFE
jgi:hypothetical protein